MRRRVLSHWRTRMILKTFYTWFTFLIATYLPQKEEKPYDDPDLEHEREEYEVLGY